MSQKIKNIIQELQTLTLLEASNLILEIERIFGVMTTLADVSSINTGVSNIITPLEEKTTFTIVLNEVPLEKKMSILKVVRTFTGLGLKECKDIVDNAPKVLKEGITKDEAELLKKELEIAGGKVILK